MNTQRKFRISIFSLSCIASIQIHTMHNTQQLVLSSNFEHDAALFTTGALIGAGCVGAYCWLAHQEQCNSLEQRIKLLEEKDKNKTRFIKDVKHTQKAETKRLDQTRQWIMEEQEQRQTTLMQILEYQHNQKEKLKLLHSRLNDLEDGQFFSPENSFSE